MAENQFDAVIIGGGLGGLTAGAHLSKKGRKVLLLEQHYIPGGCSTTFKRKDFIMEVGLHEMDGLDKEDLKTEIFDYLGIFDNIELIKVPELYRLIDAKHEGFDITFPDGVAAAIEMLTEKYPNDKKGIKKFFTIMLSIRKEIVSVARLKQWQINCLMPIFPILYPYLAVITGAGSRWAARMNPLFWLLRPRFAFWKSYNVGELLDRIIKNEQLKIVLLANLGYYHDDPYTMSIMYYGVAQASYYEGGGYYVKGGSQKLANYLANIITSHGGKVLLGKRVKKVLVENGKATGVTYQNAFDDNSPVHKVAAEVVIANAAIPNIVDMLSNNDRKRLVKKTEKMEHACSLLSVYLGFKKNLKKDLGNKAYSTYLFQGVTTQKELGKASRKPFEERGFVFVDYSQVDSGLAPPGKSVGAICTWDYLKNWDNLSDEAYKKEKERVAQLFIKQLEKIVPGVSKEVEYYEVGTPKTIARYTLNPSGSAYGFAQTPEQSGMRRITHESPVKNLYFASAWTFPGGGFTGAILGGNLCAKKVVSRFAKQEKLIPDAIPDTQTAQLVEKNNIALNTMELVFEKPKDFERFQPGQYAIVSLDNPRFTELDMPFRSLSIASHPDEAVLRFAMRKSNSAFKKSCEAMKIGDTAKLYGPAGNFILEENNRKIVFLIAGIGITPVMPLLKELEKNNFTRPTHLFYSNSTEEAAAYHDQLRSITHPPFVYRPIFSKKQGRINGDMLLKELNTLDDYYFYIVGTKPFIESMKDTLYSKNVKDAHIKVDDFG